MGQWRQATRQAPGSAFRALLDATRRKQVGFPRPCEGRGEGGCAPRLRGYGVADARALKVEGRSGLNLLTDWSGDALAQDIQ